MEPLVVLRSVVVVVHLVGFATLFGGWLAEAVSRRFRATTLMNYGIAVSFITGLALAAPWPAGVELNYVKLGIKLVILIVIGALLGIGIARERRGVGTPRGAFWLIGILTLAAAAIAVMWGYAV